MGGMLAMLAAGTLYAAPAKEPSVIPIPASVTPQLGSFQLRNGMAIVVPADDAETHRVGEHLAQLLSRTRQLKLKVRVGPVRPGAINLHRVAGGFGDEAYRVDVRPDSATVAARTTTGLLYGAITLWQLATAGDGKKGSIPAQRIDDAPRFAWRGVMLDSARHYQSPEFIRQFIDWMALHKLNVLHWHLTDDQAWRLEIRKYPALTAVGAWRIPAGPAAAADIDPTTGRPRLYGGFYSQETVRQIVAHAARQGIAVVPEIEMPGHASAALAAYPALAATPHPPRAVPADWGIYPNVYSLDDNSFRFLEDVLTEVMELFPSRYLHVGGDEVEKEQWKSSAPGQARMRELGITERELQGYFTQRIGRFLEARGKRLVGWDEILEPGLPAAAVVMSWRGIDGALAAAAKGHDTVLSPWPMLYFDNRQSDAPDEPPGRARIISLETVYRFEPMPAAIAPHQQKHVLGLQGNVWTEHIRTEDRVATMTFPRAAAIAELGWSQPQRRGWTDFVRRLAVQMGRYDALGLPYSDSAFAVQTRREYSAGSEAQVELFNQTGFGDIRYTLDGREPTAQSPRYRDAIKATLPAEVRAATFLGSARLSRPRTTLLHAEVALRRTSQQLNLCSEHIALGLEDDAPIRGPRTVFMFDIQNPCWIFPRAPLDQVAGIAAAVGQVPFNFQIGEAVRKISFPTPRSAPGELEVRIDGCEGEVIARLPLAPAGASHGVTELPSAAISPRTGRHDLCLRFAQAFSDPALDQIWALDWVNLIRRQPSAAAGVK